MFSIPATSEQVKTNYVGAAIAQFTAFSSSEESFCASEPNTDSTTIINQGTVPDTYYLTISSSDPLVASWIKVGQTSIALQPGQEQQIYLYITPPADAIGSYTYTVTITSLYDSVKQLEKTFHVGKCPNIAMNAYVTQQETCPCSTGVYVFEIANSGSNAETYDLWLTDIDPAYYVLSENTVTLVAGETKDIYAYVRMACFVYGDFSFTMTSQTRGSSYTATIPLSLHIEQGCYNYNIALGEALVFDENMPIEVTFTETESTEYILCQETPAIIPIKIQNPSSIMNEYHIAIEDAEEWITPAEPYTRLTGMQEHITSVVVNSGAAAPGLYSVALKVDTLRGDLETVLPFTVEVQDCSADKGMAAWLQWSLLSLLCVIVLAILVVGAFLYKKKELQLLQWLKKHKKLLWIIIPLLLLFLIVALFSYPIVHEKYAQTSAVAKEGAAAIKQATPTVPTLFYNWVTVLIIIALLLLLCFIVWWFKIRKKHKKIKKTIKDNKKRVFFTAERQEKIKPVLKWLWIIFLLLLLLTGLGTGLYFLYQNYKEDASKFLEQNETVAQHPSEESEIEELKTQISEKEQQISDLEEQLMKIAEEAAQKDSITTEQEQAYQEQIITLQKQIEALEKQLQELLNREKNILETINGMDTKINAVTTHVNDVDKKIQNIEEQIEALQKLIATLSLEKQQINETAEIVSDTIQQEIDVLEEEKQNLEEIIVPPIPDDNFKTVLAFDVSLSTQIIENGKSRFERGIEAATKYIQEKGTYTIMIVGKNAIIIKRDIDGERALKTLITLRPLDTQSNLGNALYDAADDLNRQQGRIVLISDLQTTDGTDIYAIRDELESQGIDVVFINIAAKKNESRKTPETTQEQASEIIEESQQTSAISEESRQEGQKPSFDVESQTSGSFFIEIPKNTVYSINLNKYFTDADGDQLFYDVIPGEHLSATIQENIVTLTPEKDWEGETTVVFTAEDGKGGSVRSPAIRVTVLAIETDKKEKESMTETKETGDNFGKSYVPWIILGSIIFLILFSLVVGAFARKFHQEPYIPPEQTEEHEKKKKE